MVTMTDSLNEVVDQQVNRFSGLEFHWLSFPKELGDRFEKQTVNRRCARLWLEGLIAIALFDLFLVADYFGTPQKFGRALLVRLLIITPLALLVNLSMRRRPREVLRESSIAFVGCLAGLTHLYLASNVSPVASAYAQLGVLAVVLFTNIVMRLRFPYAATASIVMLAGDIAFLQLDDLLTKEQKILGLCLAIGTIAITMVANYSSCREERLSYLLHLRGELLVEDLNRSNAKLLRQSESDALTGLANRHSFDMQFAELWKNALVSGTSLSVVVVDVDHFKQLNDKYGHLYGDEVLKRVGSLLMQALRVKGDFAARFGGDEFVILLPATNEVAAVQVAERLRKLVELAGFPALDPSYAPLGDIKATVCCGVATTYPTAANGGKRLLEAADKALYKAKARGRNRVCFASQSSWSTNELSPAGQGQGLPQT